MIETSTDVKAWAQAMKKAIAEKDQEKVIELWYGTDGGKYNQPIGSN